MGHSKIRSTLIDLGAISEPTISLFSPRTRDANVPVYRDDVSGVIFIDEYFVGENVYSEGTYRDSTCGGGGYEDVVDTRRRLAELEQFYSGKNVVDLGCGEGNFLRGMKSLAHAIFGTELQESSRNQLMVEGIPCFASLEEIPAGTLDVAFMMHMLEHLPDPLSFLKSVREKLIGAQSRGRIIIEVPHAKDFLIDQLHVSEFVASTLWSQHLVLHTRASLRLLLTEAGFTNIVILGVQRYPLSNHLAWLAHRVPGGHKTSLSAIDSPLLLQSYASALAAIDATDTLLAVADVS